MRKRVKLFKKKYAIKHRRRVRFIQRVRKHPAFFVPTLTFSVLVLAGLLAMLLLNHGQPVKLTESNSKIVILNADKQVRIIPTRAQTVGDLLKRLNITLHQGDVVEPAKTTVIVSDNFKVNVYRALPVTIIDGGQEVHALSAAATPRSIARQAGLNPYPEDRLQLTPIQNFVTQGLIGQKLEVDRATPVTISLYGAQLSVRTQAKTVGEFLREKHIRLGDGETVQPDVRAPIDANVPIFVNRKGVTVQTATENIPFTTQYVEDESLTFGVTAVRQQGSPGKRVVTYQINTENGARTPFQQIVVQEPVVQIVARGTYVNIPSDKKGVMAAAGISPGEYTYVDYIVSRESGWRPNATNGRTWGLCQALPGSKMSTAGSDWKTNPVTQLKWCTGYAKGRYGSWAGAYSFWSSHHYW